MVIFQATARANFFLIFQHCPKTISFTPPRVSSSRLTVWKPVSCPVPSPCTSRAQIQGCELRVLYFQPQHVALAEQDRPKGSSKCSKKKAHALLSLFTRARLWGSTLQVWELGMMLLWRLLRPTSCSGGRAHCLGWLSWLLYAVFDEDSQPRWWVWDI